MSEPEPLSEARVAAYVRGEVSADERAAIEIAIDRDPQWLAVVAMMARIEGPLGAAASSRGEDAAASTEIAGSIERDAAGRLAGERDARLVPGTQLGRYRVEAPLGRGAMGMVYAAHDPELDREVALKLLHHGTHAQARMVREARALARVQDPRVLAILDVGVWRERVFVATELLRGVDLHAWRVREAPRWETVVDVYAEAARGLAAAHARGVIHRDFKPANVMRTDDGRVVVLDFGLAELDEGDARSDDEDSEALDRTASMRVIGTPAFMAPEQRDGRACGPASDQFSFCVALWSALLGAYPAAASHPAASVGHGPAIGRVPRALLRVLERGLADSPADRHASMSTLVDALAHVRAAPSRRRRGWLAAAIAVPAVAWLAIEPTDGRCGGAERALAEAYDSDRAAAVGHALAAADGPDATASGRELTATLEAYAASWREAHAHACAAASPSDPAADALLDARMACLEDRRVALDALLDALERSPRERPSESVAAAVALPPVAPCRDAPPPRPHGAWSHRWGGDAQVEAIAGDLAHVRALRQLGSYATAAPTMDHAIAAADTLGDLAVVADVRIAAGGLAIELGRLHDARAHFEVAIDAAETVADDVAAATAAVRLAALLGEDLGQLPQARALLDRAAAWSQRVDASALAIELERVRGQYELAAGNPAAAREHFLAALARIDTHRDDVVVDRDDLELLHNGLGNAAMQQGQLEIAAHEFELTHALLSARLGADHPNAIRAQTQMASIARMQGDAERACALLEGGLAMLEAAPTRSLPTTGEVLVNLAVCELDLGREAAALEHLRRAESLLMRSDGAAGPMLAKVLALRGDALIGAGRSDEAVGVLARALASYDELYAEPHHARAEVASNLGTAWNELGNHDEAARWQLRAVDELIAALGREHPDLAFLLTSLSQTRALQGRHDQALELAREAVTIAPPPLQPFARARVGEELAATGALDDGVAWMQQALAEFAGVDMDPALVAGIELSLAEAQWSRGRHDDARAAAERALAGFERTEDAARAETTRTWLAEHTAARPR